MTRKGKSITLSIPPDSKAKLEALALRFGYTWGDKPNLSALLTAIAHEQVTLSWPGSGPTPEQADKVGTMAVRAIQAILAEWAAAQAAIGNAQNNQKKR